MAWAGFGPWAGYETRWPSGLANPHRPCVAVRMLPGRTHRGRTRGDRPGSDDHTGRRHEPGIGTDRIEIAFDLRQITESAVDRDGPGEVLDGLLHVAAERLVAGEVVVEDRLARAGDESLFQHGGR